MESIDKKDKEYDSEKYKFLYEYKKYHLDILRDNYKELENKASKYLTFITLFLTVTTVLCRTYLTETQPIETRGAMYYASLILLIIFVFAIFPVLRWLFLCLKINKLGEIPKTGIKEYVKENEKETVYMGLSDRIDEVVASYKKINNEKAAYLKKAFAEILWCSLIFLAFIITFILNKF
ncbi:hypothetical protein ACH8I4_16560 [Acinetobacter sp. ABJ_C3_5]|uniref:hypothetical protein n=1 Tax=Acinetobacter courvalinii TaxID=280147 RepID=UPI0037CA8B9B